MPALNIDRADFLKEEDIVIFEDSVARFLDEHAPESRVAEFVFFDGLIKMEQGSDQ